MLWLYFGPTLHANEACLLVIWGGMCMSHAVTGSWGCVDLESKIDMFGVGALSGVVKTQCAITDQ